MYAGSVGAKFSDLTIGTADAEVTMAVVGGIFALFDVFDAVTAIKAIARYKKLSKGTAEVLSSTKKSYKLLLEVEPELLDDIVSKLKPNLAQKILSLDLPADGLLDFIRKFSDLSEV